MTINSCCLSSFDIIIFSYLSFSSRSFYYFNDSTSLENTPNLKLITTSFLIIGLQYSTIYVEWVWNYMIMNIIKIRCILIKKYKPQKTSNFRVNSSLITSKIGLSNNNWCPARKAIAQGKTDILFITRTYRIKRNLINKKDKQKRWYR